MSGNAASSAIVFMMVLNSLSGMDAGILIDCGYSDFQSEPGTMGFMNSPKSGTVKAVSPWLGLQRTERVVSWAVRPGAKPPPWREGNFPRRGQVIEARAKEALVQSGDGLDRRRIHIPLVDEAAALRHSTNAFSTLAGSKDIHGFPATILERAFAEKAIPSFFAGLTIATSASSRGSADMREVEETLGGGYGFSMR